jgi:hypothetical protein
MNDKDKCHLMIDVETLGTRSNAVILSIGAVLFDLKGNIEEVYHRGIDIDSCLKAGLQVDGGTIEWWMKQEEQAIARVFGLEKYSLEEALYDFMTLSTEQEKWYIWSHGSNFDTVLIENAYKAVGKKVWWKYTNVRDTRTLFDVSNYKYKAGGAHDALEDAKNQAYGVINAYQQLMSSNVKPFGIKGRTTA